MLKSFLKVAAVSLVSSTFYYSTAASALDFNFLQYGFVEEAFVTGTFSGQDLDNNGQLSSWDGEVTNASMFFSGNSLVDTFSMYYFNLVYDLDGGPLGDGFSEAISGSVQSGVDFRTYFAYQAGRGSLSNCEEGIGNCGQVFQSYSSEENELSTVLSSSPLLVQIQPPPGTTPEEPVLPNPPTPANPGFNFDNIPIGENGFGVDINRPLFFDPDVAVGYDYSVTSGPNFSSVLIPDPLPNGDDEFLLELPGISNPFVLSAGTTFNLLDQNAQGFSNFTIRGIAPEELLDPLNTTAFVTGLTFMQAGTVSFVQDPIVENFDQPVIPEPSTILASALLGLGFKLTRRKKA